MKIAIVGRCGGSNIGESFQRAAEREGHQVLYFDMDGAEPTSRLVRSLGWRLLSRRSLLKARFEKVVLEQCRVHRPNLLLTTGLAPLSPATLSLVRAGGTRCANYSTDDPWNPEHRQEWFFASVPEYDVVFTPRVANVGDFRRAGARRVEVVRFGYDEDLFPRHEVARETQPEWDIFFAGGADAERARTMGLLLSAGIRVLLAGSYWDRFPETRGRALGQIEPADLGVLASRSRLGLCLLRRANRDDHSMRTFELPRMGIGVVVESSSTHVELFARHPGAAILYGNEEELPGKVRCLLGGMSAVAVREMSDWFSEVGSSYRDRLRQIVRLSFEGQRA